MTWQLFAVFEGFALWLLVGWIVVDLLPERRRWRERFPWDGLPTGDAHSSPSPDTTPRERAE